MQWPRRHGTLCKQHGGNTANARKAENGRRRAAEIEADATALLGFDLSGDPGDPMSAIGNLAAMAIAQVEASSKRVAALHSIRYDAIGAGTEQLRAEVAFMERSMDRAHKFLDTLRKYAPDSEASAAKNLLTSLAEQLDGLGD